MSHLTIHNSDFFLPSRCTLRQATSEDIWSIRWLVFGAKLDPTQIRAAQFWIIEFENKIIACGQLRNFSSSQELGSLVVKKNWQNQGLGTFLTQHLIQQATKPLYLECLGSRLKTFYIHRGFTPITFDELPPGLKSKFKLSQLGKQIIGIPVTFMHYQHNCNNVET